MPDKLKIKERDPTEVKKRKNEVVDVLADIKKATNFIDKLAASSTPNSFKQNASKVKEVENSAQLKNEEGNQEENEVGEEDDEAQEFFTKKRVAAAYPFKSKAMLPEGNTGTAAMAAEESKDGH